MHGILLLLIIIYDRMVDFLSFFFKWNYKIVTLTWINGLWAKYDKKCTCLSVFNNHRRRLDKLYSLVAGRGFISCNLKFVCTVYNVPVSRDLYLEPSLVEDLLLLRYFVTVPLWNYAKGDSNGPQLHMTHIPSGAYRVLWVKFGIFLKYSRPTIMYRDDHLLFSNTAVCLDVLWRTD